MENRAGQIHFWEAQNLFQVRNFTCASNEVRKKRMRKSKVHVASTDN